MSGIPRDRRKHWDRKRWRETHADLQDRKCFYCGTEFHPRHRQKLLTLDHKIPLNKDGEDSFENTAAACSRCNRQKRDLLPEQFVAVLQSRGRI